MKNNILELPKNIKQIGSINPNQKIYIEDFVFTYLKNYSKEGGLSDRIAILVGENVVIGNETIIFINGAIKGKYTEQKNGICTFTEECFDYIDEQLNKYFKNASIIGWFYSQPECSEHINQAFINYHKELFREGKKIFLLSDYVENIYVFHKYSNIKEKLDALEGFIIYYEKNEKMNEYMLANKLLDEKIEQDRYKIKDEMLTSYTRGEKSISKLAEKNKKTLNFLSTLSAGLIILCFMMGTSLIQSDDRITELEERLVNLDESYKYVLSQIKNDNVQSVFASNTNTNLVESKDTNNIDLSQILLNDLDELDKLEQPKNELVINNTSVEAIKDNYLDEYLDGDINLEKDLDINLEKDLDINLDDIDATFKTYKVKQGDTLESISNKLYGTREKITELMEINDLDDPNKIYVDMILKLAN